jgi:hypothetical protein
MRWYSVGGANSYRLYRGLSGGPWNTIVYEGAGTDCRDENLAAGTYSYKISARNSAGESALSDAVEGTTVPATLPPGTPVNFGVQDARVTGADTFAVVLGWDSVFDATSYQLWRATVEAGPYAKVYDGSVNGYIDSGLNVSTTYYYKVQATNSKGSSDLPDDPLPVAAGKLILIIE